MDNRDLGLSEDMSGDILVHYKRACMRTEDAVLLELEEDFKVWFPLSVCTKRDHPNRVIQMKEEDFRQVMGRVDCD